MNDMRMVLKISMSANTAPSAPMKEASQRLAGLSVMSKPIPNGAVKPNAISMPAMNATHFLWINSRPVNQAITAGCVKIIYAVTIASAKATS